MNAGGADEYEAILDVVRGWAPARRFNLVQAVLQTLAPPEAPTGDQPTLDRARGLLATDQPAPSDAEVAAWLDERRSER